MAKQVYMLRADLVGFRGIHRTIAVRSDQTLVDVHYALQAAFDWGDDHLYSFWPEGQFWSRDGREYTHPTPRLLAKPARPLRSRTRSGERGDPSQPAEAEAGPADRLRCSTSATNRGYA